MQKRAQHSILTSKEKTERKAAALDNLDIQRSLNQSIRFLNEDIQTYLNTMERISSSIDKIIKKGKLIVGEIDFSDIEQ